ncbi:2'-5' RNA ligase family protein [Nocardioides sp. SR21]|uniref:2'-5' RNA ligase family protein n=1 Tax=Nocardioides sp. SR21 TaxID=2919501 RepID=UPI001FAA4EDD|nr:2'-5' RNA ligase family protein [Nocardioides sp. SR21]
MTGHSVLQVPVPQLEPFVRARTLHHDPSYLAADPAFVHAHVTALAPFADALTDDVERRVAAIAADTAPFDFVLARMDRFPDGTLYLVPEPDGAFRAMTARLAAEFPEFPPYAGAFPEVVPHLTLDLLSDDVFEESTLALLGDAIPARCRAERLDLVWYEPGAVEVRRSWRLG